MIILASYLSTLDAFYLVLVCIMLICSTIASDFFFFFVLGKKLNVSALDFI